MADTERLMLKSSLLIPHSSGPMARVAGFDLTEPAGKVYFGSKPQSAPSPWEYALTGHLQWDRAQGGCESADKVLWRKRGYSRERHA